MSERKLRALIADDEGPARKRLRRLLEAGAEVEVVGEAADGLEALERIEALKPDAIFLDIEMPELDGFGVARAIGDSGPAIIFVTAYDQHALRAFEASAVDYLVKPVTAPRLEAAIQKLRKRGPASPATALNELQGEFAARLAVRTGNRFVVFETGRIAAIIARDHYSAILVEGRELLADDPLDALERKLDPARFMRIHRGAIVNLGAIQELEREGDRKYSAILSDPGKTRVPVSREKLDALKKVLGVP